MYGRSYIRILECEHEGSQRITEQVTAQLLSLERGITQHAFKRVSKGVFDRGCRTSVIA